MQKKIYLDNSATTKISNTAYGAMLPYFLKFYENASSSYEMARNNRKVIDNARDIIATSLNANNANEVYFTSGGTEANNWAIKGVAHANRAKGKHIITTSIEHHSVLHCFEYLQKSYGYIITYVQPQKNGIINIEEIKNQITDETILVSVMFANNETGALQPIYEIGQYLKKRGILFHTDAVQAFGHIPIDVSQLNIDLVSLSAHKLYGPKGVGALYVKSGTKIEPIIHGGSQERSRRAGTENVPLIVGFGVAVKEAIEEMYVYQKKIKRLSDMAIDGILGTVPYATFNGDRDLRLPHIFNISFKNANGESMVIMLDYRGIVVSSGSACTSGATSPSHVLLAMGCSSDEAGGAIRISLSHNNKEEDIQILLKELPQIVSKLRAMSLGE